jgi:hypothetical protein
VKNISASCLEVLEVLLLLLGLLAVLGLEVLDLFGEVALTIVAMGLLRSPDLGVVVALGLLVALHLVD